MEPGLRGYKGKAVLIFEFPLCVFVANFLFQIRLTAFIFCVLRRQSFFLLLA